MNNIVAPSLLSCDFTRIAEEIGHLENIEHLWLHLDIMDGHFVPNLTFGMPVIKKIREITKIPLDAHLMVSNPEFHMMTMKDYGLDNITFHYEAVADSLALIQKAKPYYPSVGISIKPGTSVTELSPEILQSCDLILVMSVEPGFGGQSFIESSYEKIKILNELREQNSYTYQIQVDGGVSNQNSHQLRLVGANNLVAGSYVFNTKPEHYKEKIQSLRQ